MQPLLPSEYKFPFAIRVNSEVLSRDGCLSEASVSSACLALHNAGIHLKAPIAGNKRSTCLICVSLIIWSVSSLVRMAARNLPNHHERHIRSICQSRYVLPGLRASDYLPICGRVVAPRLHLISVFAFRCRCGPLSGFHRLRRTG